MLCFWAGCLLQLQRVSPSGATTTPFVRVHLGIAECIAPVDIGQVAHQAVGTHHFPGMQCGLHPILLMRAGIGRVYRAAALADGSVERPTNPLTQCQDAVAQIGVFGERAHVDLGHGRARELAEGAGAGG